jgi:hypothetical protein
VCRNHRLLQGELLAEALGMIPTCIAGIHEFWRNHRSLPSAVRIIGFVGNEIEQQKPVVAIRLSGLAEASGANLTFNTHESWGLATSLEREALA